MNYLLPFVFLTLMTWSCQSNQNSSSHNGAHDEMIHEGHGKETDNDDHDHDAMEVVPLALNNGQKWKTDEPTKQNADRMKSVTKQFKVSNPSTLSDFQKYGSDIKSGLDQMIQECTMTGAEDQALHQWFFPILENTGEIGRTDDTEKAKHLSHGIIERIEMYDQFFN